LADDGYLVLHDGRIYSGLRLDSGMACDQQPRTLTECWLFAIPIRTKGDLLPVKALDASTTLDLLMRPPLADRSARWIRLSAVTVIVDQQLRLEGTFTAASETAKKNGGGYDFDWIAWSKGRGFHCS